MMARVLDVEVQQMCRDLENEQLCEVYVDDPQVFAADEILDIRAIRTEIEYCVKWTGYSAEYNEWVAEEHVTPDLKREFSIGKKKKEIQLFKHEKAKARVMRKKHGRIAKSSSFGLTSTPIIVPSISRTAEVRVTTTPTEYDKENGTSLSMTMSVECEHQIPEWATPKEDSQESDTTMSETSSEFDESEVEVTKWTTPKEDNVGCDALMSTVSSKSGESEGHDATMSETSSEFDESGVEVTKCTTPKEDNVECDTLMTTASSKSGESEGYDATMSESETSSVCDKSKFEIPEWTAPKDDNAGCDTSDESEGYDATMSETSSVCDEFEHEAPKLTAPRQDNDGCDTPTSVESGIEVEEQNISPSENEENGPLVSAVLSSDCTTETTRRESGQSSVMSISLVAESESDVDSFEKQLQHKECLLGFDEQLQPESQSNVDSFQKEREPEKCLLGFNEHLDPVYTYM
ncbi:uncharacterized protein LOC119083123 isoform X2 [Bradysia coprophila]|uniref:uncharacterized protein LOC119083123 isoform X2 n=1 Tax=Bradysia coprophila TaxID=38358 RepID=UPI00187D7A87|nr:uncharacterized protein LOC119083123 isoform X2 [Bradysia coprophila]